MTWNFNWISLSHKRIVAISYIFWGESDKRPHYFSKICETTITLSKVDRKGKVHYRKYAAKNDNINTVRKFKTDFLTLTESTVQTFKKECYKKLRYKTKRNWWAKMLKTNTQTLTFSWARWDVAKIPTCTE